MTKTIQNLIDEALHRIVDETCGPGVVGPDVVAATPPVIQEVVEKKPVKSKPTKAERSRASRFIGDIRDIGFEAKPS